MKQRGKIDVHGLSIRGAEHRNNHDHFAIAELAKSMRVHQSNLSIDDDTRVHGRTQGQVYLIADGISDGPAPAEASSQAIDRIVNYFLDEMPWFHLADGRPEDVTLALKDAVRNAQDDLLLGRADEELGITTTLTLAFVSWPDLFVAHLGRSRCFIQRQGMLRQLTTEHALDTLADRVPEVQRYSLEVGDVLALCSDGVAEERSPDKMVEVLGSRRDAEWMCGELVTTTGDDDRTAIVVRFVPHERLPAELPPATPPGILAAERDRAPQPRPARPTVKTPRHRPSQERLRPANQAG